MTLHKLPSADKPATLWPCDIKPAALQTPAHHPCRQPRAGRQVDPGMDKDLATAGNVGYDYLAPRKPHPSHVATSVERWYYRSGWRMGVVNGVVVGTLLGVCGTMLVASLYTLLVVH
jgi:hypothetical protein